MPEPIIVDVGWRNCSSQAALAFFPPELIGAAVSGTHCVPAVGGPLQSYWS